MTQRSRSKVKKRVFAMVYHRVHSTASKCLNLGLIAVSSSELPLCIVKYGVVNHAGSLVRYRCPLGSSFIFPTSYTRTRYVSFLKRIKTAETAGVKLIEYT